MEKISSGSFDLNDWLSGGYESDIVTMIVGGPGTGKTNLCTLAACSVANKGKKVIFVDTEGGFSVDRVRQIVGAGYSNVLEKILILSPTSFKDQIKAFEKLLKNVDQEQIGLIVIDSVAMHYRLELGDACSASNEERISNVNREVANQMKILSQIARDKKIPVLITNQVYSTFVAGDMLSGFERETNIVGGDLLQYWSKCILELKKDGSRRKAILLKHRSLPVQEFNFIIKNEGIFRAGWF